MLLTNRSVPFSHLGRAHASSAAPLQLITGCLAKHMSSSLILLLRPCSGNLRHWFIGHAIAALSYIGQPCLPGTSNPLCWVIHPRCEILRTGAECAFASDLSAARVPASCAIAKPERGVRCCLQSHSMGPSMLQWSRSRLGPACVVAASSAAHAARCFRSRLVPSSSVASSLNLPRCHARVKRFRQSPSSVVRICQPSTGLMPASLARAVPTRDAKCWRQYEHYVGPWPVRIVGFSSHSPVACHMQADASIPCRRKTHPACEVLSKVQQRSFYCAATKSLTPSPFFAPARQSSGSACDVRRTTPPACCSSPYLYPTVS